MAAMAFTVNGRSGKRRRGARHALLWILREHLKLAGTKYGCGTGLCGACTVHVGGRGIWW